MMDTKMILALLVFGHVIADFVLQDNTLAQQKKNDFKGMYKHIRHHFLVNAVLLLPYLAFTNHLWWIIIVLAIVHGAIDMIKVKYDKVVTGKGFESFIADQMGHIIFIGACYPFIKDIQVSPFAQTVSSCVLDNYPVFLNVTKQQVCNAVIILTGYIFNFKGATVITVQVLDKYLPLKKDEEDSKKEFAKRVIEKYEFQRHDKTNENASVEIAITEKYDSRQVSEAEQAVLSKEQGKKNAGEAIGILERILILTLVLQKNYATIGVVLAGKTLARYKKLEEKNFAEYFLIGTFTSIILAFFTGILIETFIAI